MAIELGSDFAGLECLSWAARILGFSWFYHVLPFESSFHIIQILEPMAPNETL